MRAAGLIFNVVDFSVPQEYVWHHTECMTGANAQYRLVVLGFHVLIAVDRRQCGVGFHS